MELEKRLSALDKIYGIYDEFAATLDLACQRKCAHCCTPHVTLTTLEGYKLLRHLPLVLKTDLLDAFRTQRDASRFRPKMSTNQLAQLCAQGISPPDAPPASTDRTCSLLADRLCSVYELRPFGCRCLVSRYNCGHKGYAEIDDFVLSANTVFLQTIEHLDINGCTGNLTDVLETLLAEDNWAKYDTASLSCTKTGLISNHPLTVLMIPPEHRAQIQPVLEKLRQIKL
jgi:hypothetical protein